MSESGGTSREDVWVMQLVVRVERDAPPTRSDVCAAAARAVVALLADPDASGDGDCAAAVAAWEAQAIRKHCRRARGAAWEKVTALPGVSASVGSATVRVLPPTLKSQVPDPVRKLQLSGSELPDPDREEMCEASGRVVVISVSADPELPLGKAAAAAGHAAQLTWRAMPETRQQEWLEAGLPVRIEHPNRARWTARRASAGVVVQDAGYTVVEPGTVTATATWQ